MANLAKNWKTTLAGVACFLLGVGAIFGVHVPGFESSPGVLLTTGIGLIVAKDSVSAVAAP